MKMSTIVGIFIFISRENFMLSCVEFEKSFITLGPGLGLPCLSRPVYPNTYGKHSNQGPVVQSVVSLMSSLRVISLTVLADSIYNILIFFAEKM